MKNYIIWLKHELKSINTAGSVMLAFIIGVQLAFFLTAPIIFIVCDYTFCDSCRLGLYGLYDDWAAD